MLINVNNKIELIERLKIFFDKLRKFVYLEVIEGSYCN